MINGISLHLLMHRMNQNKTKRNKVITLISKITTAIFCLCFLHLSAQDMSKNEAIRIAEQYVQKQGYSNTKLDVNSRSIDTLLVDKSLQWDAQDMQEARFNTLRPKSFYSKKVTEGWLIGFKYTKAYIQREKELLKTSKKFAAIDSVLNGIKRFSKFHIKSKNEAALLVSNNGKVKFLPYSNLKFYARKYKKIKRTSRELQTVSITDPKLLEILINGAISVNNDYFTKIDQNNDGKIQIFEAEAVKELKILKYKFNSFEGIEYFKNLEKLILSVNDLTFLDLSQNKNLKVLVCTNNNIENIDLSTNKKLNIIDLRWNALQTILLPKNVEELQCDTNKLTTLNLSDCKHLKIVSCPDNMLTTLDISNAKNLIELWCSKNNLTQLNLKNNIKLEHLWIDHNPELLCLEIDNLTIKKIGNFNHDPELELKTVCH